MGYVFARAKFLECRHAISSGERILRGLGPLGKKGFQQKWDSNGGSFSGEIRMSARNQAWPWFAVLAKSNREKSASWLLENAGYECYLPTSKFTRKWSDRTKEVEVPLFPGYFFCRIDPSNRLPVLITPGVIQIVGVGKTPIAVPEEEIAAIQRAGKSGLSVMPWPYIEIGQAARIEEGPLRDLTGIVVKIKSGMKLVLSVSLLQRSVAVEIDRRWVSSAHEDMRVAPPERQANHSAGIFLSRA
jgi:transcription antitermination factor NusG